MGSGSVDRLQSPPPDAPNIPALPADVAACERTPVDTPDRDLNAGEIERLWKTDRAALAKVNGCLRRAVCQYQDVREGIGRVEGVACESTAPAERPAPRFGLFKRKKAK
ncbi:hypothetical protein [Bradyrhizobium elkanii]|uniref:hypothetical protein n=1 Tax=Bradyrhizobium elkanii TaxID=29448 RepID=UPI00036B3FF5|nr:hypothetical protein [Bradyrhizobium elkanii]WAX24367.1 hypothetical protein [Bradyrhizobium phage ppBeUSDA76-1]MCP1731256.1 hypothetical protein [Bradyrhizobium elkanii]MCS3575385.1 hypothetical protein [Bradyrhizobium elkanii]MCS3591924.1 hypothetical protein [Bradyrhizobium elkanii]MCS3621369.1 hypothetical protein [Bradyrhizobium elkanii]